MSIASSKTNNNNGLYFSATMATPQPSSAFFGLLRAFHAATLHHTAKRRLDHIQQPTGWHLLGIAAWAAPNGRDSMAGTNGLASRQVHLDPSNMFPETYLRIAFSADRIGELCVAKLRKIHIATNRVVEI